MLDPIVVRDALRDPQIDVVNQVALLRAHPDIDSSFAVRLWREQRLDARSASHVLAATGPDRGELIDQAITSAHAARTSGRHAAHLAAAMALDDTACENRAGFVRSIAADPLQPLIVRAVAAWTTSAPLDLADDPAWRRYTAWVHGPRRATREPLLELLGGSWQAKLLT